MNRLLRYLLLSCVFWSGPVLAAADDEAWHAGAAKTNITPQRLMWMAGYGARNRPAEGTLTDLWAKALVLEDPAGNKALLITLDLVGIDRPLSESICQTLCSEYGLERHQIAICVSHTHTGPVVARNLAPMHHFLLEPAQQALIDQYAEFLQEKVSQVVAEAWERRAPSQLSWGTGTASFAVNRRNNREPDVPRLRSEAGLQGPVDHDVPVLAVSDATGELKAVVFGYACHATVLSFYQWSGDYPGFAQMELEARHPGCTALFFSGCGGDQNPLPRRTVELARHYGRRLADSVDAVLLTSQRAVVSAPLTTRYREIELPLDTLPSETQLATDARSKDRFIAARAKMLLEKIAAGTPLAQTYPYPIGVWKFGDELQWVFLGGEVVVDYSLRLKAELKNGNVWVAGYANDVMAYIPSRRVLREGGYEGARSMIYYGLPTIWSPDIENAIVSQVHALVGTRD